MHIERSLLSVLLSVLFVSTAAAQPSFEIVHAFSEGPTAASGRLLEASDGLLYGTSTFGGTFDLGTAFSVRRQANGTLLITELHSFTGLDGANPRGGLIEAGGFLYGTTARGGAHDRGAVIRMTFGGSVTVLHSFNGTDGAQPLPLTRARDGNFYGLTENVVNCGDALRNTGVVYRITPAGAFTLLRVFNPSCVFTTEGVAPRGTLVQGPDGHFYGTTSGGGELFSTGTFFKVTSTGELTTLYGFNQSFIQPSGELILGSDGNFYGSTIEFGHSAAFQITPQGSITFLHQFTAIEGDTGEVMLEGSDGNLYFATGNGFYRMGAGGSLVRLRSFAFNSIEGGCCVGGMIEARDGRFYGVLGGGLTRRGGIVGMTNTGTLTAWNPFIVNDAAGAPIGPLVPDGAGNLYGTSCQGGLLNAGAVFKMTAAGAVSTVHSFLISDGLCPVMLMRAADQNFYGVALRGGSSNLGTIFKMTPAGAFTVLRSFSGLDGALPSGLMQASNGTFYGTTWFGGGSNAGTLFRLTGSGAFTSLHHFAVSGCGSVAALTEALDGNLYGTTQSNCGSQNGTLYRFTPAGTLTTLYDFVNSPGRGPAAALTLGADGRLYGTTASADFGTGALFVATTAGQVTHLHTFVPEEGGRPIASLVQAPDGALYGTTYGSVDFTLTTLGTVFKASVDGAVTVLHTFSGPDGSRPSGPLTRLSDGSLIGTTFMGGPGQRGVIFRIVAE